VAPSAEFVMRQTLSFDETRMMRTLQEGTKAVHAFDADGIAEHLLGDAIHANMLLVGTAFQKGLLPLSLEAVTTAIRLNGVAVEANLAAFAAGRLLAANPTAILGSLPAPKKPREMSLAERVAFLAGELEAYQDRRYADRFRALVAKVHARDEACGSGSLRLTRTVAENLYRLMAAKDEYEVARLYLDPAFQADLEEAFEAGGRVSVLLAPPLFARTDPDTGRPRKMAFRRWIFLAFRILVRARRLRGTWADPFGHTHERRTERQLLRAYEADIERIVARIGVAEYGLLCELARVPDAIRGYGPVKAVNIEKAQARRAALLSRLERPLRATVTSLEAAE
jgi:indolepyruvate ferredoxin oxidoreductase